MTSPLSGFQGSFNSPFLKCTLYMKIYWHAHNFLVLRDFIIVSQKYNIKLQKKNTRIILYKSYKAYQAFIN